MEDKKSLYNINTQRSIATRTWRLFVGLLWLVGAGWPITLCAQSPAPDWDRLLQADTCLMVAHQIPTSFTGSERDLLAQGRCLYLHREFARADSFFVRTAELRANLRTAALYWSARARARQGEEVAALAQLQQIAPEQIRQAMLATPDFAKLATHHAAFRALQRSVAPGWNGWTLLLAGLCLVGMLAGLGLWWGRSRFERGERHLALCVWTFGTILAVYLLHWTRYIEYWGGWQRVWQPLTYWIGPWVYLYLRTVFQDDAAAAEDTSPTRVAVSRYLFVPAVVLLASLPTWAIDFGYLAPHPFFRELFALVSAPVAMCVHTVVYALLVYRFLQNEWQVDDNIQRWTRYVVTGMLAYCVAFVSYFILVRTQFFNPHWDYAISLVMAFSILGIVYMGFIQQRVFSSEPIDRFLPLSKYRHSALTDQATASIQRRLKYLLEEEEVYRENELRLADLAGYLDISYHQLSQVINQQYGVNFYELINRYRVDCVCRLLADPDYSHQTILQIAFEAGFNNKASFNRYFKKQVKLTPSAYRIRAKADV